MEKYIYKIKVMKKKKKITDKLISQINEETNDDKFIEIIRTVDECFNYCRECGCDLEKYESSYFSEDGTCNECIENYEEN